MLLYYCLASRCETFWKSINWWNRYGSFPFLPAHLPVCLLGPVHLLLAYTRAKAARDDRTLNRPAVLSTCLGEPLRRLIEGWWISMLNYADKQPPRRKRGLLRTGGQYSRLGQKGGNDYEMDRFDPQNGSYNYERSDARLR